MVSSYLGRERPTFLEPSVTSPQKSALTCCNKAYPAQYVPDESNLDRFRAIPYLIVCDDVAIPPDLKNGSQVPLLDCTEELDMMMV